MSKESSVFFPEKMQYVELIVPLESAYYVIKRLSKAEIIHLVDQNKGVNSINRRYIDDYMH